MKGMNRYFPKKTSRWLTEFEFLKKRLSKEKTKEGGARWQRSRIPKFRLVPGIQLDKDQTILNTYELNRRSKQRIAATL